MTTAYEFVERDERRITMPIISAAGALLASVIVFTLLAAMNFSARNLEKEYTAAADRMKIESQAFIDRASKMLPDEANISSVEEQVNRHNLKIGGQFSTWTRLFNAIETAMPEGAVITAIENPFTAKALFAAEDRFFRFRIAVNDTEQANSFYMKLSEATCFENLNFTPRGEVKHQGKTGFSIDIEFKFNETF